MTHTFDIRFARSGGIAALFDSPGNSFGWKGHGRISIDAHGVNVALKRGLASLLARRRNQRIAAGSIKEVYREGESLRVEFSTDDNPRATLPFWVRDAGTAARIVELLPTTRTVEMEQGGDSTERRVPRRQPVIWFIALLTVALSGALFMRYQRPESIAARAIGAPETATDTGSTPATAATQAPARAAAPSTPAASARPDEPIRYTTPEEARKLAMLAEDPVDWTSPPPASRRATAEAMAREARMAQIDPDGEPEVEAFVPMELPEIRVPDVVVPIRQATLAYATARDMLAAFEAGADKLVERYREERRDFDQRRLDARTFANHLDALEIRWRSLSDGILGERKYDDPAIGAMRGTLLIVAIQQRVFLGGYAVGLRTGDQDRIDRAFRDLALAEDAMVRARAYVN